MRTIQETRQGLGLGRPSHNILRLAANVADTETITIGSEVYEIDTAAAPGAITAGRIRVDCNAGVTPTIASAAIAAAINNNNKQGLRCVAISVNEIEIFTEDGRAGAPLPCTETLAGANNAWTAATMYGTSGPTVKATAVQQRAAVAQDVALGFIRFRFQFTPLHIMVSMRTAAGVPKVIDGAATISGNRVDIAVGAGITATDIVVVLAHGA